MQKGHSKKIIGESVITFFFFFVIGILLWVTQDQIFFLFNFMYIGLAASIGELVFGLLPRGKKETGRKLSQLLIGIYMLGVLGFLGHENMQIEGFFFYLFAGVFSGPVIHYLLAKIGGTFLFGRGWCSWACWTTMILDYLTWMKPKNGRLKKWGIIRYIHFAAILTVILFLWLEFELNNYEKYHVVALNWLIIGNIAYFSIGILLAALLKDNRAFCKYVCPIPVLMKLGTNFSIWKIEIEKEKCMECGLCVKNCPMNIKLLDYMKNNQRILSSECIACQSCVNICSEEAIKYTKGFDRGGNEYINYF